ncbi:hypothetical protein CU041_19325 [Thalassospira povalilytica]|uniref:Uncharacterized protein n=1 Tax=Thalassospira povalilytica TaxID=732237 RepID=A0ABX4R3C3_9PROT|nr:hypothetical protein CU041_19325 [Thalassospira povalilytica]
MQLLPDLISNISTCVSISKASGKPGALFYKAAPMVDKDRTRQETNIADALLRTNFLRFWCVRGDDGW